MINLTTGKLLDVLGIFEALGIFVLSSISLLFYIAKPLFQKTAHVWGGVK